MFRAYGFNGYLAYLGVIAVELTFVSSMLNIIVCRLKERPAGAPSYIGGLLGVSLVAWSNVSATVEYGIPGIVLGLFVPAALVVSEMVMSYAVIRGRRESVEAEHSNRETTSSIVEETIRERAEAAEMETRSNATMETETKRENVEALEKRAGMETERERETVKPSISSTSSTPAVEERSLQAKDVSTSNAERVAMEIYEREGRLPGRRRLMEEAGVSEWEARKTLQTLKRKVG